MEKEDPLQRLERKEAGKSKKITVLAVVTGVMLAAAIVLAVLLILEKNSSNTLISSLEEEKTELEQQFISLRNDYENLSSDYEEINAQLDSSKEEIALLIDKVKTTSATDRSTIKKYQKELGTLRSIMKSYIVQIDSLNTLNHKLTKDVATARQEASEQRKRGDELEKQNGELSEKVATGSVIKARGLSAAAYNRNGKKIDRSSKVEKLLVNLTLSENVLAAKGPVRVYITVTGPDGALLQDGSGASFEFGGQSYAATASREVDYNGEDLEMGIYVNGIGSYSKGVYTIKAYTSDAFLGTTELLLR